MSNTVTPEMIKILNSGDQRELRAFLTLYARPVYERALTITGDETDARRVTRRVIAQTALLAAKGGLEEDVDAQLMKLTDACCSEDIFFVKLVDDTMQELTSRPMSEWDKPDLREKDLPGAAKSAADLDEPVFEARRPEPEVEQAVRYESVWPEEVVPAAKAAPAYVSDLALEDGEDVPDLFCEEEEELEEGRKTGPLLVVVIFTLALVTMALVWVLLVKLMYLGVLPKFDFGFAAWFNSHIFLLY